MTAPTDPRSAPPTGRPVYRGVFGEAPSERPAVTLIPVPFDATCSYGAGTARGPEAILAASGQIDLVDHRFGDILSHGLASFLPADAIEELNRHARGLRPRIEEDEFSADEMDRICERVAGQCRAWAGQVYDAESVPGLIGGEHSVAFGGIWAAAERHPGLGVLQIDAHMDLRSAYEGMTWSHASVMRNALERIDELGALVQVGIRDYCPEERSFAEQDDRVTVFYADDLADEMFGGVGWNALCPQIVSRLPDDVWVSFDIDGLEPHLCPTTGTPVPGGLSFMEASRLLHELVAAGKRVVGFDLCEVAPGRGPRGRDSLDAIVGMRVLSRLCGAVTATRGPRSASR